MPDPATLSVEMRGQRSNGQTGSRTIRVRGTLSIADARAAAYELVDDGAAWDGMGYTTIDITEIGYQLWECEVQYSIRSLPSGTGGGAASTLSFDTSGTTQTITVAKAIRDYQSDVSGFDPKLLIGLTENGPEGCEVIRPAFTFERTAALLDTAVTSAYVQTLFSTTGKVNSDTFYGFAAGQVLYRGARGTKTGNVWEIVHLFSALPNPGTVTIGSLSATNVKGWDYVWTFNVPKEFGSGPKILVPTPTAIVANRVYDETAFSAIGV